MRALYRRVAGIDVHRMQHVVTVLLEQPDGSMQGQLAEIDAYLLDAMQPYAWAHQLLQTIPGIDEIAAALILIEIGDDMSRFGRAESLACWTALSPGNNESAGKRKSGRTGHGLHRKPLPPVLDLTS